jgi:putative ABC transport system permease protein
MARKAFGESEVRDLEIADRNLDVYIPYASLRAYFKKTVHASHYDVISMRMADEDQLIPASRFIHHMISKLHGDADDFEVSVPLEKIRQAQQTKEVFNVIIVVIAAISLLVGGIGIMNIMLATVTERTREIGIRRAEGASQRNIMNQFLSEALLISLSGSALGLLVGMAGGRLVEAVFAFPVCFNPAIMLVAVMVSMFVGIGFGIYPAWLAARMDPVEALRS